MPAVELESFSENMTVTNCVQNEYKSEECEVKYVVKDYQLPGLGSPVDKLVELEVPVPEKTCQTVKINVPEINCRVI